MSQSFRQAKAYGDIIATAARTFDVSEAAVGFLIGTTVSSII